MPIQGEPGRRLALIVATSDYRDPTLHQLRAPGRDASDLAEVLGDPAIGIFDVRTLMDTPSDQLLRGIAQFCGQASPGDLLLIYLSCHGVLDDRGRLYYATIDTERSLLSATAVAAQWLTEQLDDSRAHRKILLLDCCHSGAFARGAKGGSELALKDRFSGRGNVVLTASGATEYSFEGANVVGEGVRSVFTRAVVDGLRTGQADCDKDGLVTVNDLYHHVYDTVRAAEPRQTPKLWAFGTEGDLLVAHSPRGPVVEPAPLPEDVRLLVESSRLVVRESGVRVLADLLDHGEPGLALTARQTLQRISEEDLPRIAALARAAQDADHGQAVTQLEAEEQARREAEEQARREAERAAARHRRQVEQPQQKIRERAAAEDWDAVVAADDELAALDPAAADPDALASAAREQITGRQKAERAKTEEQALEAEQAAQQKAEEQAHSAPTPTATPTVTDSGVGHVLWALVPVLSLGVLLPFPFAYAAARLHSWKLWVITFLYASLWLGLLIAVIVQGSVGHLKPSLSCSIWLLGFAAIAAVHALRLRRRVLSYRRPRHHRHDPKLVTAAHVAGIFGLEYEPVPSACNGHHLLTAHGLRWMVAVSAPNIHRRFTVATGTEAGPRPAPKQLSALAAEAFQAGHASTGPVP